MLPRSRSSPRTQAPQACMRVSLTGIPTSTCSMQHKGFLHLLVAMGKQGTPHSASAQQRHLQSCLAMCKRGHFCDCCAPHISRVQLPGAENLHAWLFTCPWGLDRCTNNKKLIADTRDSMLQSMTRVCNQPIDLIHKARHPGQHSHQQVLMPARQLNGKAGAKVPLGSGHRAADGSI